MILETMRKYGLLISKLPYEVGQEAAIFLKEKGRCYRVCGVEKFENISEESIVDVTENLNLPEKDVLLKSRTMDGMIKFKTEFCGKAIDENKNIYAALDDMAQIVGHKVSVVGYDKKKMSSALKRSTAVMVKKGYAYTVGRNLYEAYVAMTVLEKSAEVCEKAKVLGGVKKINTAEAILMRTVYLHKYSKAERKHKDECEG